MSLNPSGFFFLIIVTYQNNFKTYFLSNIVKYGNFNTEKYFDYNVLLSTFISTGVPYHLKQANISYIDDGENA